MSFAKRMLVISRPLKSRLLSWSSNTSHMILSRKMKTPLSESNCSSKRVSCAAIEKDCTLNFVRQIFNEPYGAGIDVVFPHSCPEGFMPYPVKGLLEIYEDIVEILLMLQVFLAEDPEIEYLFFDAPFRCETSLLFYNGLFRLWLESV